MKTRSRQFASAPAFAPAAMITAFLLAVFAVVLSASMTQAAFADDEDAEAAGEEETTIELSTTQLKSADDALEGVTDKYVLLFDTKTWEDDSYTYKVDKKERVVLSETTDEEGARFIQIEPKADTAADMVIVQIAGDYLESAIQKGSLQEGKTYLIPVAQDAKILHVALYQAKDDEKDANEADAASGDAANDSSANDADATAAAAALAAAGDTDDDGDGIADPAGEGDNEGDDEAGDPDGEGDADGAGAGDADGAGDAEGDGTADGDADGDANGDQQATEGEGEGTDGSAEGEGDATLEPQAEEQPAATDETPKTDAAPAATTTKVSTYAMSIGKVDAKSNAMLSGAEFVLKDSAGNTFTTWTSSSAGAQRVDGLRTDTTYVLSETKAPQGYNREKDINVRYDAASNKVMIDQGGTAVALDNNSNGEAMLNVKDMTGSSPVKTSASTSPKTGDNQMIPVVVGVLAAVVVIALVVAVVARKRSKKA